MHCELDHLVMVAATLEQGAAWCEATLGVAPGSGGAHPLMGTHNRLLALGGSAFPRSYLEIIAIDPAAPAPGRARWFGMDDPRLQVRVAQAPRLVHAVLRTSDLDAMQRGLIACGLMPGVPLAAHRDTPRGRLSWRIVVRDDGRIEGHGALPTLIEWHGAHPTDAMTVGSVALTALRVRELPATVHGVLRWREPDFVPAPAPLLQAVFDTPRGEVLLSSAD
jgi:hypothetical protein